MDDGGTNMLLGMLSGTVGLALLIYGKKQVRPPHMLIGLVLMVFPYFMPNAWFTGGIALGLVAALAAAVRMGW
jgi:hypothetical protein